MLPKDLPLLIINPKHLASFCNADILSVLIPCIGKSFIALDNANSWPNEGASLSVILDSLGLNSDGTVVKTYSHIETDREYILSYFVKVRYLLFKATMYFSLNWTRKSSKQARDTLGTDVLRVAGWLECLEGLSILLQMEEGASLKLSKAHKSSYQAYLSNLLNDYRGLGHKYKPDEMYEMVCNRADTIAETPTKRLGKLKKIVKRNETQDDFTPALNGFDSGSDLLSTIHALAAKKFEEIMTRLRKLIANLYTTLSNIYEALKSNATSLMDKLMEVIQNSCKGVDDLINDANNVANNHFASGTSSASYVRKQMIEPLRFLFLAKTLYAFTFDKYSGTVANDVAQYAYHKVKRAAVVSVINGVITILNGALQKLLSIILKVVIVIAAPVAAIIVAIKAAILTLIDILKSVLMGVLKLKGVFKMLKGSRGVNRYYYSALLATGMDYEKESKELGSILFTIHGMGDMPLLNQNPVTAIADLSINTVKNSNQVSYMKDRSELHYRRLLLYQLFSSSAPI